MCAAQGGHLEAVRDPQCEIGGIHCELRFSQGPDFLFHSFTLKARLEENCHLKMMTQCTSSEKDNSG